MFRSKHVKDNLSPMWEPATIDVNALCDGDLDRRLQVAIFDHESSGKHVTMGTFETTGGCLGRDQLVLFIMILFSYIIPSIYISFALSERIGESSWQ